MSVTHGQCDARLPSQLALVPNYTAWWQRHMCEHDLPRDAPDNDGTMWITLSVAAQTLSPQAGALSYSALQWIAAALHNLTGEFWNAEALHWSASKFRCKWAWHSKMATATNFRLLNVQSCQLHCLLTLLLRLTTETSTFFLTKYKLNLFTKLVYKQIGAVLQSVK